ncbi:probable poly(ADP-ribose) glycohydrolase 2 [Phtheirospermum japonicum]|uniref:poly(ADP-ribose) glycohydrolase n=1 Tax=Phtheirospermum japonicum TaxID=374723 RepID=A0A830D4E1_9LAMI|nr:probable poly(ADP-ribose) glycohydrolase 2 [Phtheirospermum japonicum]
MESREDFRSILPFLPVTLLSSAVCWPPAVVEALKTLSKGPSHSNVNSGQHFAVVIADLRLSLGLSSLNPSASLGFSVFFDDMMKKDEAEKWFGEVVPRLAELMLRLPTLLEAHYQNAVVFNGMETGLRVLEPQQPGIVFLSQELIAALLVCALFCLFPTTNRDDKHLRPINFDRLFVCLYQRNRANQENKIKCIVHYFEKVCRDMPMGNVSFERKVLPLKNNPSSSIVCPEVDFWSKSNISLCRFKVHTSGLIEDQSSEEALEVDFANKYIGGGALRRGCVQEEIRFMINPELIVSILFLPMMDDNEAIEIVGAERFSDYTGYSTSFRFSGDYEDKKSVDEMKRRRTRIIAIDALRRPGNTQYSIEGLLRETNKAFCGFFIDQDSYEGEIGVATGNWGCGAFGGDPEVKAVIQWLAASQAMRPFVMYYTFGLEALEKLELVVQWIVSQKWSVGELWSILEAYSGQRLRGETSVGLFRWLVPSLYDVAIE